MQDTPTSKAKAFRAECDEFCRKHRLKISTLSQKALRGRYAIDRLPRMAERIDERIAQVRRVMAEIEKKAGAEGK